ncbi:MAG: hypothetical protein QXZ70_06245 [Candidatus Bathyarchaeia archaeon]
MSRLLRTHRPIFVLLVMCLLLSSTSSRTVAQKDTPPLPRNDYSGATASSIVSPNGIIYVTDSDWSTNSVTSDCAQGWGNDEWHLTLSQPKTVRIRVDDCCCPGDYYSVYVNGNLLGTTPKPAVWGCDYTGNLSSGTFDIFLPTGTHTIKARDVSFSDHSAQEIAYQRMCPAGFTLSGTLLAPPAAPDVTLETTSWEFNNNTSPYLPEKFWLSVTAKNVGAATANNVIVRFYLGNPDQGGTQIGADQALGTIASGGQAKATVEWTLSGNVENQGLFARAFVTSDINTSNNTTSKTVSVWYIPFRHDIDAYSFSNWGLEWQDIVNDLLMFLDINHPDNIPPAVLFPVIYPLWSMLLESGGHCYGMAATSSLYYQFPEIKPVPKTTYAMTKDEARSDIQYYHRTQTTHIMEAFMMRTFGSNTEAQYNAVRSSIRDRRQPIMLLMQDVAEPNTGGHAVVAYKILDLGDEKRIYMYDNNRPLTMMSRSVYAAVNTRNKTFLYASGYGYDFDRFLAKPALMTWPDAAEVIVERFYKWVLSQVLHTGLIRVSVGPSTNDMLVAHTDKNGVVAQDTLVVDPLITDQYGRRIGYVGGNFVNEIPGATLTTVGNYRILDLPSNLQYVVNTVGTGSGNIALSFLIPETTNLVRDVEYFDIPVSIGSTTNVQLKKGNTDWTLTNTGQPPQQPDSIIDTHFYQTFLPAVTKGPTCGGEMIVNPGFEQGADIGWSKSSTNGRRLIYSSGFPAPVTPHSGNWAAWLGGVHNEVSLLSQTIIPPANATSATLTYWYWIQSGESSCIYDHAWVELNGGLLRLHDLCSSGNTNGWRQAIVNLTPYLGQPIGLRFYVDTDSSIISHFFIDDVSLNVQCSGQ